jgi:DNA-binding transcriptional MocR family regulator
MPKNVIVRFVNISVQYLIEGKTAREILASVEAAVRSGDIAPGGRLPAVRPLAARLGVSPATVAAAYGELRRRGMVTGSGRAGTRIRPAPPLSTRGYHRAPSGTRDLITGAPDPALLPLIPARPVGRAGLYADMPVAPRLQRLAAIQLAADGIDPSNLAVTGGALDAIERVLAAWLRPGDRIAVEDPGHAVTFDLLAAMDFSLVPVPVDEWGMRPDELARELGRGLSAVVLTPRAQAATGAAWDAQRATDLADLLHRNPQVGVIEDDHAGPVAGVAARTVSAQLSRWAHIRSVSKSLGPDLRLAIVAGDEATIARVAGRQALGTGWVSYQLQETVADLWSDRAPVEHAARVYAARRHALRDALAAHGITATGHSGLTSWIPVADEERIAAGLASAGWGVGPGRRFRIAAGPGVRVSFATLEPAEAVRFAADLGRSLRERATRVD